MTSVQYTGHATALYMDYIDGATGRTLTAEPGGTYDVRVAPGRNPGLSPVPGDGRWTAVPPPEEDQPAGTGRRPSRPGIPCPHRGTRDRPARTPGRASYQQKRGLSHAHWRTPGCTLRTVLPRRRPGAHHGHRRRAHEHDPRGQGLVRA